MSYHVSESLQAHRSTEMFYQQVWFGLQYQKIKLYDLITDYNGFYSNVQNRKQIWFLTAHKSGWKLGGSGNDVNTKQ